METNKAFHFKTNINCGGCIASVKPYLDNTEGVSDWEVNTTSKEKILTVTSDGISQQEIIDTVQKAGFTIEPIPVTP